MAKTVDILRYLLQLDDKGFDAKAAKADARVDRLAAGFSKLSKVVYGVAAAFAAFKLAQFIKDAALTAARTEVLGTVVERVGTLAGYSRDFLEDLTEQIKALGITTHVARTAILRFIQSNLDLADAAKLARTAQDLAVISGQNSSQALETIVQSIAAQFPRLLRQFGIVENLTEIYRKQAAQLGKTAQALTQLEKKQAFVNVILAQGAKVAGSYEAAMGDVGKRITSLPRHFEELQNALGTFFIPALGTATDVLTKFLIVTRAALVDDLTLATEVAVKAAGKFARLEASLPPLIKRFTDLRDNANRTARETSELYQVQDQIRNLAPRLVREVDGLGIAYKLTADSLEDYLEAQKAQLAFLKTSRIALIREEITELERLREGLIAQDVGRMTTRVPILGGFLEEDITAVFELFKDMGLITEEFEGDLEAVNARLAELSLSLDILTGAAEPAEREMRELGSAIAETDEKVKTYVDRLKAELATLPRALKLGILDEEEVRAQVQRIMVELSVLGGISGILSPEFERAWDYFKELSEDAADFAQAKFADFSMDIGLADINQIRAQLEALPRALKLGIFDEEQVKAQLELISIRLSAMGLVMSEEFEEAFKFWKSLSEKAVDDSARDIVYTLGDGLSRVADVFGSEMGKQIDAISRSIVDVIAGISTGGPTGIISAVTAGIGGLASIFSTSSDRLVASQHDLQRAIEEWRESVERRTQEEQRRVAELLPEAIQMIRDLPTDQIVARLPDRFFDILDDLDISLPAGLRGTEAVLSYLQDLLDATLGISADFEAALAATDMGDFTDVLRETSDLTYRQGTRLIDHWADVFDLSAAQQLELYRVLEDVLAGGMTAADILAWREAVKQFEDSIEAEGMKEQTQISRSIARITERQADSLMSILMTIDLHLREYLSEIAGYLQELLSTGPALANVGGGAVFTGDIVTNVSVGSGDPEQIAATVSRRVEASIRAVGGGLH